MAITVVFFDVGGTLIHPDMSRLMAPLLEHVAPNAEQLQAADRAAKHALRPNGDDGAAEVSGNQGHWDIYFNTLVSRLNGCGQLAGCDKEQLVAQLIARANDSSYWTLVDPKAAPTLERLKRDYRLAVISNADGKIRQVLERAGLDGFFSQIVDSGLAGYEKPDPRIFRAALAAVRVEPEETLYVGDIYAVDYRGATGVGMHAVLLDPGGTYSGWNVARVDSLDELPAWIERLV
jgi:HAD superfamily hydrolase (TIGR01509 family)